MKEFKRALRKTVREIVDCLEVGYCIHADQAIFRAVTGLEEYKMAETIFCFVGTKDEINTSLIINHALGKGKRVAVPRCVAKGVMEAFVIDSLECLEEGHYGIPEPGEDAPRIAPGDIDLAVIPCLSCSRTGMRLGYGGGYYDRYLQDVHGTKAVICREKVMREDIPMEEHDQMVDMVISENGVFRV